VVIEMGPRPEEPQELHAKVERIEIDLWEEYGDNVVGIYVHDDKIHINAGPNVKVVVANQP